MNRKEQLALTRLEIENAELAIRPRRDEGNLPLVEGLSKLTPTNVIEGREARVHRMPPSPDRWKERSRTYQGIADAMAAQWGATPNVEFSGTPAASSSGTSALSAGLGHPHGQLLTVDEVLRAIAATGDSVCAACGTPWTMHRIRCEGSE